MKTKNERKEAQTVSMSYYLKKFWRPALAASLPLLAM